MEDRGRGHHVQRIPQGITELVLTEDGRRKGWPGGVRKGRTQMRCLTCKGLTLQNFESHGEEGDFIQRTVGSHRGRVLSRE